MLIGIFGDAEKVMDVTVEQHKSSATGPKVDTHKAMKKQPKKSRTKVYFKT